MTNRDPKAFAAELEADGWTVETKTLDPGAENTEHTHDQDVRGLVIEGLFGIDCQGARRDYAAGETFALAAGAPHREVIGPEGATVVLAKRAPR